ncbi:MAG: hypothetical protein NTY60_00790 [Proteobacteria bacterium]|nr:hypothetical protein [Pseudomonadota bacterium]
MKTLYQHLKQVFDSLEFTSVGHLDALTAKLDSCSAPSSAASHPARQSANRINNTFDHSKTAFTN